MNRAVLCTAVCQIQLVIVVLAIPAMPAAAQIPGVEHFVLIGIDGLSPAGIRASQVPEFKRLIQQGASTMHARAVMPTSSSPNWASMIMGAGPEQHGITSNEWERNRFSITPTDKGPEGIFPTIYGLLRRGRPRAVIGVFHDWDGYGRLVERDACDTVEDADGPDDAMQRAINFVKDRRPTFTFVHLDHVDHAGHQHGWGSPEYLRAVEHADRLIGKMREALADAHIADASMLLVTADHGGKGTGHGGDTMEEIEIPWILVGPAVRRGFEIAVPVDQFDTAGTIAHVFGLKPPSSWIARPVTAAFEDSHQSAKPAAAAR
jgi:predicted AlkP superfamily pyrophosphatase or phosphodiesterase